MGISLDDLVKINYEEAISCITKFIADHVKDAGASGVVVGVSGGVDSSTALALAVKALGSSRVHALIMPDARTTPEQDITDARSICEKFSVRYDLVWVNKIFDGFMNSLPFFNKEHNIACGNLRARIRMCILYYYANLNNMLVLGTSDRSEILIGYYTKYGDGGVDLLPLGCLYKTQVRHLAVKLGIPKHIAFKPSSPRLWPGHMAEEELGLKYEEIDLILYALFDLGLKPHEAAQAIGLGIDKVNRVVEMHVRSRHKRAFPPIPRVPWVKEPVKELSF